MRFSLIAAAVMASVVAADITYYSTTSTTVIDTVTSCGPEVTSCPGRIHTSTLSTPVAYVNTSSSAGASYPAWTPTYPASSPSVKLGTTYITTCIPTVITSLYTVTPTPSPSSAYVTYAKNSTTPTYPAKPPTYTGAATAIQGSVVFAAAAGLVAFFA